jgi:hypothetical protein
MDTNTSRGMLKYAKKIDMFFLYRINSNNYVSKLQENLFQVFEKCYILQRP